MNEFALVSLDTASLWVVLAQFGLVAVATCRWRRSLAKSRQKPPKSGVVFSAALPGPIGCAIGSSLDVAIAMPPQQTECTSITKKLKAEGIYTSRVALTYGRGATEGLQHFNMLDTTCYNPAGSLL